MVVLIIVLLIFSVLCTTKHQYPRLTADATLYFSIAQKYVNGDLSNAINGYWGPLLAWLLIPFAYFGTSHVFAINMLNLVLGVLTITGIWVLSFRFEINNKIRIIILISSLPIVLKFSLVQPMDFLLVCILIYYFGIVFNNDYQKSVYHGIFSGVLGALAYFTKAYAFPFFIVHFFLINIFHYFRDLHKSDKKYILKNAIIGFIIFFLITSSWIMIISEKYGYLTFSTMRETNFNAPGPEAMGGGLEFGVPIFYEGFFEPPNETAFVVWEDPSYIRGKPWSAWESWGYLKHFIKLVLKNIAEGLLIFESFSTLSVTFLIFYVILIFKEPFHKILSRGDLLYPLFTVILFTGGYVLFHFEPRYLWPINILLLLMGGHVLYVIFQKEILQHKVMKNILIGLFLVSFIFIPSRLIIQTKGGGMDLEMHHLSTELDQFNIQGNIASNREYVSTHDAWHKTFRLAYWLNGRYYGQARENINDRELENDLKKHDIDYYFLWGESIYIPQFLNRYRELTRGAIQGLQIFSLKEKKDQ
jgi:hypothetical protein